MRLRVSSIDHSITKLQLQEMFEEFGEISSVKLFRSLDDSAPALGFVEMKRERDAMSAMSDLNGLMIGAARLKVEISSDIFRTNAAAPPKVFAADTDDDDDEDEDDPVISRSPKLPKDLGDELDDELGDEEDEEFSDDDDFDDEDSDEEEEEREEILLDELDEEI